MTNTILIPTDFSEVCDNAIAHGAEIARYLNSKVYLLHVVNRDTKHYLKKHDLTLEYIDEKLDSLANTIAHKYNIPVGPVLDEGSIFSSINQVAVEKDIALMILGTHGKVGIQKLTGSNAMKLVHQSPAPVIVVQKRGFGDGYKDIVVPVHNPLDFELKTRWVAYIARMFGAKVHMFQIKESDIKLKEDVDFMTNLMCSELDKNTVSWNIKEAKEEGDFSEQLENYASELRSDLIIIMTNALDDHPEFILGPWEDKLVYNESQIPVMCLNPLPFTAK